MRRKRIQLSNSNLKENVLNEETIDGLFSLLVPIGTILPYAGNRLLDELVNFTLCDGKELIRLEYPKLFNVIGTDYGVGDGSTTFNVPDLTSRFLEGSNTAGTVKEAGIPNITGQYSLYSDTASLGGSTKISGAFTKVSTASGGNYCPSWYNGGGSYDVGINASNCSPVYGKSDTVQPASVTVKYIIRCK